MADPVDWNDPCARADWLRGAYYRLVSGSQEESVQYQGNGVTREVKFASVDMDRLLLELRKAESECATANDTPQPRKRFAIQAGSRRAI